MGSPPRSTLEQDAPRARSRWLLVATLIGVFCWLGLPPADAHNRSSAASGTVYLFAITNVRPRVLQKSVEQAMPGVNVSVFGRVGDFSRALKVTPPDAAIALAPVLETFGLAPALQGVLGGEEDEVYLVVSAQTLNPQSLAGKSIGCLDLVERRHLPTFVATLLGSKQAPEIQRVTKVEDLLQLLQFQRADAVLLPERFYAEFAALTKLDLKVLRLPSAKAKRMAVAFPGNRAVVEAAVRNLPNDIKQRIGIDGWK